MRKHNLAELINIAVTSYDLGNSNAELETTWCNPCGPVAIKDVRDHLVEVAGNVISELSKELPKGMTVGVYFSMLPEHEKEILEGIDDAVLP